MYLKRNCSLFYRTVLFSIYPEYLLCWLCGFIFLLVFLSIYPIILRVVCYSFLLVVCFYIFLYLILILYYVGSRCVLCSKIHNCYIIIVECGFNIIRCPPLSYLLPFGLKCTLSGIRIATLNFLLLTFAQSCPYFQPFESLCFKSVSFIQHRVGFCYVCQFEFFSFK